MSRRVLKYRITRMADATDERSSPHHAVPMPLKAKTLCVDLQDGELCLWAEIDDADPGGTVLHHFALVGTGWEFNSGTYVKTVFFGPWVLHLYDMGVNLERGAIVKEPK